MTIQRLPEDVISQIAAGEVVERPASVVKELLENALDAGATNVHIEADGGGRRRIRISDDGSGIPADEVELAVERHATSKLRRADDLERIRTLGFRGEALASIAAVSQMTLVTRHRDDDIGTDIHIKGGSLERHKPVGAPAGTVVTVEHLFYNLPARLKFLKSESTEKRHITTIVQNYAMAYPDVRFTLVMDGRETLRTPGSGQLSDVVVKVLGLDYFKQMLEVNGDGTIRETGGDIQVYGFISQPDLHRRDRTRVTLFLNGRAIQDRGLTYAVTQAYHNILDDGRYPYAVLMLDVPPYFVDVNVHPTKAEVRFQDTNVIFATVQRTVRQGVMGFVQATHHQTKFERGQAAQRDQSHDGWSLPYDRERQMDMELSLDDTAVDSETAAAYDPDDPTTIPEGMGRPKQPRTLPMLRVVGQIGAAYIVSEGPAGMYLIDQHAAHTRVIFEELKAMRADDTDIPQRELQSQTIDLPADDADALEAHLDILQSLGVRIELFGNQTFQIRAIPAVVKSGDVSEFVWSLVEALTTDDDTPLDERLLQCIAERAAVKAGQLMDVDDMRSLIRKLERTPNPHASPSGSATLIHMSADQLAREFGRNR